MTHDLSDIIEVMVFLHLVGVPLDIAPLFETLGDLEAAPGILNQMFDYEPYRAHLKSRGEHQQIMLGYSDSNKDCGYLTANWALFQAQETIAEVCKKRGLGLTLFHGRGGSIARGGGPAAKAILAQPCGCYDAKIRVTEQGEVLSTRYHDPDLAFRIIEQMAYGVLLGAAAAQQGSRRAGGMARRDDRDVEARLQRLRGAGAQGPRVHRILENRHAHRRDRRPQARLAPDLPPRHQIGRGLARDPVGFLLDAEPLRFPGLVRPRQRARAIRGQGARATPSCSQTMYNDWMFFKATIDNAQLTLLKADMQIALQYAHARAGRGDPRAHLQRHRRRIFAHRARHPRHHRPEGAARKRARARQARCSCAIPTSTRSITSRSR